MNSIRCGSLFAFSRRARTGSLARRQRRVCAAGGPLPPSGAAASAFPQDTTPSYAWRRHRAFESVVCRFCYIQASSNIPADGAARHLLVSPTHTVMGVVAASGGRPRDDSIANDKRGETGKEHSWQLVIDVSLVGEGEAEKAANTEVAKRTIK